MSAFSYRPGGYKFGIVLLFFTTVAVMVGVIAPYWASKNYSSIVNATSSVAVIWGLSIHEGPWMLCVSASVRQSNASTSAETSTTSCGTFHIELEGWFHVVRALVTVSVAVLLAACVFALVTNCCRKQPVPRNRILELLVFLGGILAMAGVVTYEILRKENSPTSNTVVLNNIILSSTVLRDPVWTYAWAIYLSGGAGVLVVLTSFVIGAFNKKLVDNSSYRWFDSDVRESEKHRTAADQGNPANADNRRLTMQADDARMVGLGPTPVAVGPRTDVRWPTATDVSPTAAVHWAGNERTGGLGVQNTNVEGRVEEYPWFRHGRDNAVGQGKKAVQYQPYAAEAKNGVVREGFQNQRNVDEFPHYAGKNRNSQQKTEIQSPVPDLVRGKGQSGLYQSKIQPDLPPLAEFANVDLKHAQLDQIQLPHGNGPFDQVRVNDTNLNHGRFSHANVDHTQLKQGNMGMRKTIPDVGVQGRRDFESRPAGRDDPANDLSPRPKSHAVSARPRTANDGGYEDQWSDLWTTSTSKEIPSTGAVQKSTSSHGGGIPAFDGNYPGYIGHIPPYERNIQAVKPPPYDGAGYSHARAPGNPPVRGSYPHNSSPAYQHNSPALDPPGYGGLHMSHLAGAGPSRGGYPQDNDKLPPYYHQNKPALGPPVYGRVPLTRGGFAGNNPPY